MYGSSVEKEAKVHLELPAWKLSPGTEAAKSPSIRNIGAGGALSAFVVRGGDEQVWLTHEEPWYARGMFRAIAILLLFAGSASAQAPSPDALRLSLHSLGKALAVCQDIYTRTSATDHEAMLRPIVGSDGYQKDITSLAHAEALVNGLLEQPQQTSGRFLVAILSSSDDFSIGVGSTRTEVMRHIITEHPSPARASELLVAAESLNNCQKALFDAGDDYVGLVMAFVGAQDDALAIRRKR